MQATEGQVPAAYLRPGHVFARKYRVDRVIGRGGMGVVVAAVHLKLEEMVAIKLLAAGDAPGVDELSKARFLREAQAVARLKGQHVVRVHDADTLDDGVQYIVMEYLEGADLATVLERSHPLPISTVVDYVLQACEAVAEAHAIGLVHRDLKPRNLFLANFADGSVLLKVLDFGIAKTMAPIEDARLTETGTVLGSPAYMSPEQIGGSKQLDVRSDIWSLGVCLYEALTNRLPFEGSTWPHLIGSILTKTPVPLGVLRPDLPPGLARAVERSLAKEPGERPSNIAELAAEIAPFASAEGKLHARRARAFLARKGSMPPPAAMRAEASATFVTSATVPLAVGSTTMGNASVGVARAAGPPSGTTGAKASNYALPAVVSGVLLMAIAAAGLVARKGSPEIRAGRTDATPIGSASVTSIPVDALPKASATATSSATAAPVASVDPPIAASALPDVGHRRPDGPHAAVHGTVAPRTSSATSAHPASTTSQPPPATTTPSTPTENEYESRK
jgi:serine/threonine-protein kinase